MRIGLDFDNTIVKYDEVFHRVAREVAGLPDHVPVNKVAVRDYLRSVDREDEWTEMQGLVYGARMGEAAAYDGVLDFMAWARDAGHTLFIVSHKTRHPFRGPAYDLHEAARAWTRAHVGDLICGDNVFFELTKAEKWARIGSCGCDLFVDDLPEILLAGQFPAATQPILFDPEGNHRVDGLASIGQWADMRDVVERRCLTPQ